jgi:phosphatidylglycerol lysyltransferase
LNKSPLTDEKRAAALDRLEEMAYEHGQAYDSYLSTEGNLTHFWSSDQKCVLAYAKVGRFVHVQGGLFGPMDDRPSLLREFADFVRKNKYVATFYNIGEGDLPLFRDQGFQITKWGEEPLLDVADVTWSGHEFEWVRRQANYCRRHAAVVEECIKHDYAPSEWDELMDEVRAIKAECLSTKPQRGDVRFFNGDVDPPSWDRRRLFVARSEQGRGRIEGFLICLPYDGGRQWSIETYRHRLDAPRGIVAFMIHQTIEAMKTEVIETVSLCLCPAVRYERLPNDSWIIRRCLQFGFNYASAFFDMPGEYHFKSRFRPRFIRRYICHWPQASAASMWSIVRLSGALELDLKKFTQNLWHRFVRPKTRCHLATPSEQISKKRELVSQQRSKDELAHIAAN